MGYGGPGMWGAQGQNWKGYEGHPYFGNEWNGYPGNFSELVPQYKKDKVDTMTNTLIENKQVDETIVYAAKGIQHLFIFIITLK